MKDSNIHLAKYLFNDKMFFVRSYNTVILYIRELIYIKNYSFAFFNYLVNLRNYPNLIIWFYNV